MRIIIALTLLAMSTSVFASRIHGIGTDERPEWLKHLKQEEQEQKERDYQRKVDDLNSRMYDMESQRDYR